MRVKMKKNREPKLTKLPMFKRTQCVSCREWYIFERMLKVLFKEHLNRIDRYDYCYVCKRCLKKAESSKDELHNLSSKILAESISQFL